MAEMYVDSKGEILNWADTIDELTERIQQLEQKLSFARNRNKQASEAGHSPPPPPQEPGAPPEGLEEDLLEFYPPPELKDWKMGWAAMNTVLQEMGEELMNLRKDYMVLMSKHIEQTPEDELSIDWDEVEDDED